MSKVVIIGAGFSGQTAALYLNKKLGSQHSVTVINPSDSFIYTPSLIWVGIGRMDPERTTFSLSEVYKKKGIHFIKGWAQKFHPDEQFVLAKKTDGTSVKLEYDYLINATGPHLNFEGIPGLGPKHGNTYSVCNVSHAVACRNQYLEQVKRMENGEQVKILIGTGHGGSTCQGAALEYIMNIHTDLTKRGLRDHAKLMWFSNEPKLGDLGVGGINARKHGYVMQSESFIKSLFAEMDIYYQIQSAPTKVEKGKLYFENYEGEEGAIDFDFAMLIPQFLGVRLKWINKDGVDITSTVTNPAGFTLVDANYGKKWEDLKASDWPSTYQSPIYPNVFAAGIAFAPPGPISKPHVTKNGTAISPAPPRTGMASGIIGKVVALNVIDMIHGKKPSHHEAMTEMPSACIASVGKSTLNGAAATMVMYPTAPDYKRYPEYGRDLSVTSMEVGLAGAWIKRSLHTMFIYKMKGNLGWSFIPE